MPRFFFDKVHLTTKEASVKYGYSLSWFELQRKEENGPPYIRLNGKGKVYYCEKDLDNWFKKHMIEKQS